MHFKYSKNMRRATSLRFERGILSGEILSGGNLSGGILSGEDFVRIPSAMMRRHLLYALKAVPSNMEDVRKYTQTNPMQCIDVVTQLCRKDVYTVKSAYKEPAYKELPVIRNWFAFPNLQQGISSLYDFKELRL